jgi:hypothetical protein
MNTMLRPVLSVAAIAAVMMVLFEVRLLAYIDPGPAFMLWQGLLAAIIGVGVFFQGALRRVVRLVTRRHDGGDASSPRH